MARELVLSIQAFLAHLRIEAGQYRHSWREKLWMRGWNHWPVPRELLEWERSRRHDQHATGCS